MNDKILNNVFFVDTKEFFSLMARIANVNGEKNYVDDMLNFYNTHILEQIKNLKNIASMSIDDIYNSLSDRQCFRFSGDDSERFRQLEKIKSLLFDKRSKDDLLQELENVGIIITDPNRMTVLNGVPFLLGTLINGITFSLEIDSKMKYCEMEDFQSFRDNIAISYQDTTGSMFISRLLAVTIENVFCSMMQSDKDIANIVDSKISLPSGGINNQYAIDINDNFLHQINDILTIALSSSTKHKQDLFALYKYCKKINDVIFPDKTILIETNPSYSSHLNSFVSNFKLLSEITTKITDLTMKFFVDKQAGVYLLLYNTASLIKTDDFFEIPNISQCIATVIDQSLHCSSPQDDNFYNYTVLCRKICGNSSSYNEGNGVNVVYLAKYTEILINQITQLVLSQEQNKLNMIQMFFDDSKNNMYKTLLGVLNFCSKNNNLDHFINLINEISSNDLKGDFLANIVLQGADRDSNISAILKTQEPEVMQCMISKLITNPMFEPIRFSILGIPQNLIIDTCINAQKTVNSMTLLSDILSVNDESRSNIFIDMLTQKNDLSFQLQIFDDMFNLSKRFRFTPSLLAVLDQNETLKQRLFLDLLNKPVNIIDLGVPSTYLCKFVMNEQLLFKSLEIENLNNIADKLLSRGLSSDEVLSMLLSKPDGFYTNHSNTITHVVFSLYFTENISQKEPLVINGITKHFVSKTLPTLECFINGYSKDNLFSLLNVESQSVIKLERPENLKLAMAQQTLEFLAKQGWIERFLQENIDILKNWQLSTISHVDNITQIITDTSRLLLSTNNYNLQQTLISQIKQLKFIQAYQDDSNLSKPLYDSENISSKKLSMILNSKAFPNISQEYAKDCLFTTTDAHLLKAKVIVRKLNEMSNKVITINNEPFIKALLEVINGNDIKLKTQNRFLYGSTNSLLQKTIDTLASSNIQKSIIYLRRLGVNAHFISDIEQKAKQIHISENLSPTKVVITSINTVSNEVTQSNQHESENLVENTTDDIVNNQSEIQPETIQIEDSLNSVDNLVSNQIEVEIKSIQTDVDVNNSTSINDNNSLNNSDDVVGETIVPFEFDMGNIVAVQVTEPQIQPTSENVIEPESKPIKTDEQEDSAQKKSTTEKSYIPSIILSVTSYICLAMLDASVMLSATASMITAVACQIPIIRNFLQPSFTDQNNDKESVINDQQNNDENTENNDKSLTNEFTNTFNHIKSQVNNNHNNQEIPELEPDIINDTSNQTHLSLSKNINNNNDMQKNPAKQPVVHPTGLTAEDMQNERPREETKSLIRPFA